MSLFDQLVDQALRARADLSALRPVVEKELLHHDILREMSQTGLLAGLTFMGGAQSREEILADKLIALAFRENRVKNRDLWDIAWLVQQGVELPLQLIPLKIRDHKRKQGGFIAALETRLTGLRWQADMRASFMTEMRRFLPAATVRDTIEKEPYWTYLTQVVTDLGRKAVAALKSPS